VGRNASANFHKHGIAIYREIIGIFYITSYPVISLSLYVDLGSEWLWKAGELIQSIYTANVYRGLWGVHKFSLHWPWQPYKWLILMVGLSLTIPYNDQNQSFLWNGSLKIQFFTDTFCWRLLKPADVTFLKTSWWNSNFQTSWSH
jgi:hypothetical protein